MIDEKSSSEFDDVFRELENLPEEKPSARDWEQMSKRIQSEGLLESNSNGRKFFFLILLLTLLSALVSLPFIIKNRNEGLKTEVVKPVIKIQSQNSKNKLGISETKQNVSASQTDANAGADSKSKDESSTHHLSSEHTIQKVTVNADRDIFKDNSSAAGDAKGKSDDENSTGNKVGNGSQGTQSGGEKAADKNSGTSPATGSGAADSQSQNNSGNGQSGSEQGASTQPGAADEKNLSSTSASTDSANTHAQQLTADSSKNSLTHDSTSAHDASTFRRFKLGIYVSLDYNYYTLKENNNVVQAETQYVRQSQSISGDKWGGQYTVGIIGGYMFTKKLSLETGVFYSQKKKLHADIYTPSYSSDSDEQMFTDFSYDYQARYFEVYGRVKYYFYQKKNSFYVTAGAAGSYNLPSGNAHSDYFSRTSYTRSSAETEHVKLDASSASAVMVISAGMEIPVSERWVVYIEPGYRYSFNPVVKHPTYNRLPIEHFMRCLSLATGLMYKF